MCCPGCQAVASAIVDGGLERFYQYRSNTLEKPEQDAKRASLAYFDLPEIQEDFVYQLEDGSISASFTVKGITCSACAWLIENYLTKISGVDTVIVNVSSHRLTITWKQDVIKLSELLYKLDNIGYEARPANDTEQEKQREQENKQFLLRLGIAGLAMMQAGMVAIGLYAGDFYGIENQWQQLLRWVSLLLVTPVVFYSAKPFFSAAWRSIKIRHLVMDVPVSIAIALAYSASVWATISGSGEVYFDSVAMFTFFLLLGRYLEMRVRHRNDSTSFQFSQLIPAVATQFVEDGEKLVPVKSLQVNNIIRVDSGSNIPCDGEIIDGRSDIIEAVLTGEQKPVTKTIGAKVSAGTVNVSNPLKIKIRAVGNRTRLANILNLADTSFTEKPIQAAIADRLSGWFVAAVLLIAVTVGVIWWQIAPEKALWVVLSVLVVTCPCALSLATPAALTVATSSLRHKGLLIRKSHVLETLAKITDCVFDKTGTLTLGNMEINSVRLGSNARTKNALTDHETVLSYCAGLEAGSPHPVAKAFINASNNPTPFTNIQHFVGEGVTGYFKDKRYALGKPEFVSRIFSNVSLSDRNFSGVVLADQNQAIAQFQLGDAIRQGAPQAIQTINKSGIQVTLLSGDHNTNVESLAHSLSINHWQGEASPEEKLNTIQNLQKQDKIVLMVGDGINDVPVLSAADVSVAMGDAADFAQINADSILVSGNLSTIALAIQTARRCKRIIQQNLSWALLYNITALPLACAGLVPPWAAAIGMSGSSLIVVVNALRLSNTPNTEHQTN